MRRWVAGDKSSATVSVTARQVATPRIRTVAVDQMRNAKRARYILLNFRKLFDTFHKVLRILFIFKKPRKFYGRFRKFFDEKVVVLTPK